MFLYLILFLLGQVVFKVRQIIAMIRRSNIINIHVIKRSKEIKLPHETFIIDFEVRWNTTFNMLERFLEFKILIDEITINPHVIEGLIQSSLQRKLKDCFLDTNDWNLVKSLIKLLKPFKKVTDMLQGYKYETLSLSKAAEIILFNYFENFNNENSEEEEIIKEKIVEYLNKHLVSKISSEQYNVTLVN